jgi:hypothetical protein
VKSTPPREIAHLSLSCRISGRPISFHHTLFIEFDEQVVSSSQPIPSAFPAHAKSAQAPTAHATPHDELTHRPQKSLSSLIPTSILPNSSTTSFRVVMPGWMNCKSICPFTFEISVAPFATVGTRLGTTIHPRQERQTSTNMPQKRTTPEGRVGVSHECRRVSWRNSHNSVRRISNDSGTDQMVNRKTRFSLLTSFFIEVRPIRPWPLSVRTGLLSLVFAQGSIHGKLSVG